MGTKEILIGNRVYTETMLLTCYRALIYGTLRDQGCEETQAFKLVPIITSNITTMEQAIQGIESLELSLSDIDLIVGNGYEILKTQADHEDSLGHEFAQFKNARNN